MRKLFSIFFICLIIFPVFRMSVNADNESPSFSFELSVDGQNTKEVHTGDIITVMLRLYRKDLDKQYTMYAMQDEIKYDSDFFEMVDEGTVLNDGIVSKDIALVDQYREFYMNYLSTSGGTQWNTDTLIGSFQLRVIAESGVTKITNQDYLVSFKDGSGSYDCDANELTIVLSTDCTVQFMTNGGNEISDQCVQYGERIIRPEDPVREGYVFGGWYSDIHLSKAWDFENDLVQGNMFLYAKWNVSQTINLGDGFNKQVGYWLLCLAFMLILFFLYVIWKSKNRKLK